MANQPYYPAREGDQITFFTNIDSKIVPYETALDISPARKAKLAVVLDWLIWTWSIYLPARRNDGPAATAWRNSLATGILDPASAAQPPLPATLTPPTSAPFYGMLTWLFEEIGRWKKAEGYTETIGKDLGIVGAVQAVPDLSTVRPILGAQIEGSRVTLDWDWAGYRAFLSAIEIEADRDGKGFLPLATDTTPGYIDSTPFPATPAKWTYHAIYKDGDAQVGQWSSEVSVNVG